MGTIIKYRRHSRIRTSIVLLAIGAAAVLYLASRFVSTETISPVAENPTLIQGVVTKIVDGDGLWVDEIEIRLGDFDAPEWNELGGREAAEALRSLALGQEVVCTPCEGARNPLKCRSYDRIIATCRRGAERLGDLMRAKGIKEGGR